MLLLPQSPHRGQSPCSGDTHPGLSTILWIYLRILLRPDGARDSAILRYHDRQSGCLHHCQCSTLGRCYQGKAIFHPPLACHEDDQFRRAGHVHDCHLRSGRLRSGRLDRLALEHVCRIGNFGIHLLAHSPCHQPLFLVCGERAVRQSRRTSPTGRGVT